MQVINPTCKASDLTTWSNTVRLMRTVDNRTHQEIYSLYDRASKDHFWHTNILCSASLRKQWDKLTLQRAAGGQKPAPKQGIDLNNTDWINGVLDENHL